MRYILVLPLLFLSISIFGQNVNISNGFVFDGEPYLAIDPSDSQHIVIAWMGWVNIENQFMIRTKTSFDGGQTWSDTFELPHVQTGFTSADPCVDFNSKGEVFISYIDFTGTEPPVTGGVYISKSMDGGLTWEFPNLVISTEFDGTKWPIDRPWMVIDNSSNSNSDNIYITTFNLNRTNPSFNPYLSVSHDGGRTFDSKILDTNGWLAGNLNPFPMCSPSISPSGSFYGVYPSFLFSQSLKFQTFLVSSNDGGINLEYNFVLEHDFPANVIDFPNAKKGGLLLADPSKEEHLVYIFLAADFVDLDVFITESNNLGVTWSDPIRVNDDPVSNNRMQDLLWGDFDIDGDLVISWRDRRNGKNGSFQADSEIWAAFRSKDSLNFGKNFQITNELIAFDSILENSGNDFMSIKLQDDNINATWGDTRSGRLNIWFQSLTTNGLVLNTQQVSPKQDLRVALFPNPSSSKVTVISELIYRIVVYNESGSIVLSEEYNQRTDAVEIDISGLESGAYLIQTVTSKGVLTKKMIKK